MDTIMDDYSDSQMRKEIKKYHDMKRALGLTGEQLADLHRKAVIAIDEDTTDKGYGPPRGGIMAVPTKTVAYLTDIALQHIALGWEISEGAEKRARNAQQNYEEQRAMLTRIAENRQGEQDS